jgi:hypothetical protein
MNPKFKIETITQDGPHAYVRASIVTPQNFAVSSGSRLGGVRLRSDLHEPSPGIFLFRLENPSDSGCLKVGDLVELET